VRKARIAELKNDLSRYLRYVKGGGSVLVLDRDEPVAQLVPLPKGPGGRTDDERLDALERQGLIRRGTGGVPDWVTWRKRRPKLRGSVLRDLLDERRSGW
jgi:antitoxin (DNA-binding transcriptional repressor) of toxin-antitoxin stability system